MSYRPQFAYPPAPPGFHDEEFTYYFDGTNVPLLALAISGNNVLILSGARSSIDNIPLPLQQDAPFYWRGYKLIAQTSALTDVTKPNLSLRFRDCYQNDLSDGLVPAVNYAFAQNPAIAPTPFGSTTFIAGPPVPLDPEVYCPAGGTLLLFLRAGTTFTGASDLAFVKLALYGVKRFKVRI